MRIRKIRGHRRKWKAIREKIEGSKNIDLDYLKKYKRDYFKVAVHPWNGLNMVSSERLHPKGKTRSIMLEGLLEIYLEWKKILESRGEPFYLKIWLYEPDTSKSQVVCSTGDNIDFYKNTFFQPEDSKSLDVSKYGESGNKLSKFHWEYRWDEYRFSNLDLLDDPEYYEKKLKKNHRKIESKEKIEFVYDNHTDILTEDYAFKSSDVWIGAMK